MLAVLCAVASAATIEVTVVDPTGEAIPTAEIRMLDEGGSIHRVNPATGQWSEDVLVTPGGHTLPIEKGEAYKFDVHAPGYSIEDMSIVVDKPLTELKIELRPLEVHDADTAARVNAWAEAVVVMQREFTAESHDRVFDTRMAVVRQSRAWWNAADNDEDRRTAFAVCRQAAMASIQCID